MYCPEGSEHPHGWGGCSVGIYCIFGDKIPFPAGTYCPQTSLQSPISCPPGSFNGMVSQEVCMPCPVGYIGPGFNRIIPSISPPRIVCIKEGLSSLHFLCPAGYYCINDTATVDVFRNDSSLRPYPCKPGTYCLKGAISDQVPDGDFRYAQHCAAVFYNELASVSRKGSGLCPAGFICPTGTAISIPTQPGTYALMKGLSTVTSCMFTWILCSYYRIVKLYCLSSWHKRRERTFRSCLNLLTRNVS